jgi:predicted transcriptional regulator
MNHMSSSTFTVRVDDRTKKRLAKLAKNTGRSRSFLAAEAISEYLDVNEWQVARTRAALAAADRGELIDHGTVADWIESWGAKNELPMPKP